MKSAAFLRYFFLIGSMLSCMSSAAYHIAGGDFTYRWVSGNTFEIRLTLYRDCSNPIGSDFDSTLIISIYEKGTNALADTVMLRGQVRDSLSLEGNACEQPPQVCLIAGTYTGYITIPPRPGGYYMVWERCCRNSVINNLVNPDAAGMAFYAEIANPALQNSSPVFKSHPAPFICENQLFRYSFQATDDDGDSLAYFLDDPLDGGHTSQSDPNPFSLFGSSSTPTEPPPAPYANTIWYPGYSLSNILGSASPLTINQHTGEIEVHADAQGIYAMAVEVREYRNGVQIGLIRREIQLTVILCSANTVPQIPAPYTTSGDIDLFAGDTLNLKITAHDANGDSIYIIRSGGIFADSPFPLIDPPYATTQISNGLDSAIFLLNWTTGCDHISTTPYAVDMMASDNGCPASLTDFGRINIYVNPQPLPAPGNLLCIDLINDNILSIAREPDTTVNEAYFRHFALYRSVNGGPFQLYALIDDSNPLVIYDSAAFDNAVNDYCYALSAFNNCNEESIWSDTLCSVSFINSHINYITSVSVENQNTISLSWKEFNDGPFAVYYIYRANSDSVYRQIATLDDYNLFTWFDQPVNTSHERNCYYIINEDVCGNVSPPSLPACAILLQGESHPFTNKLQWSPYVNWRGGVAQYEINRRPVNSIEPYNNIFVYDSAFKHSDYVVSVHALFSYYIKAIEGVGGEGAVSASNEIMLEQQPVLYVPNSFTPNDDGRNDLFMAQSTFVSDISMRIFNRWGEQVFYSDDEASGWDGRIRGHDATAGVYFYKIRFRSDAQQDYTEQTGSITLFR